MKIFTSLTLVFLMSSCISNHSKNDIISNHSKNDIKIQNNCSDLGLVVNEFVEIGNQKWMSNDLKTIFYNNGDPINQARSDEEWQKFGELKKGCYRLLDEETILYNGYVLTDERGVIPQGYRLPSIEDFNQLYLFITQNEEEIYWNNYEFMKSISSYNFSTWNDVIVRSNNRTKFSAKPGGFVYPAGNTSTSEHNFNCSYWWTSTSNWSDSLEGLDIGYCSNDLGGGGNYELTFGFSVRPILCE